MLEPFVGAQNYISHNTNVITPSRFSDFNKIHVPQKKKISLLFLAPLFMFSLLCYRGGEAFRLMHILEATHCEQRQKGMVLCKVNGAPPM